MNWGVRSYLVAAVVALLGLVAWAPAVHATATPLAVCIRPADRVADPRALLARPALFDCDTRQTRYGPGDFWALAPRLSAILPAQPVVRIASLWQDRVTLYVLRRDGSIDRLGFASTTTGRHLRLGGLIAQPLPDNPSAPIRLLWHVKGAANERGILLGATLTDQATVTKDQAKLSAAYGAFEGMAVALLVYSLALWGALRQRFQPVYCVLLLCQMGYALSASGALGEMLPLLDNNVRLRLNVLLLGASASMAIVFARMFFERRVFAGPVTAISNGVVVSVMATSALYALSMSWFHGYAYHLVCLSYVGLVALIPPVLWNAGRRRSNYLWLFAIAWGTPILFGTARIANSLHFVQWTAWLDNSTIPAMAVETLLSSLAIGYRINLLSRERDAAREAEVAAKLLADTDPLTGLQNRRAFLREAIGLEGEQMLVLADIDHFKVVNDTLGHDGGDEVLRAVARALRHAAEAGPLVARLGGEEFAIVVPADSGLRPGDVLAAIRAAPMPGDLAVTASIGTCCGPLSTEADWKQLYRCADRALFEAKAAGRNRAREARRLAIAA